MRRNLSAILPKPTRRKRHLSEGSGISEITAEENRKKKKAKESEAVYQDIFTAYGTGDAYPDSVQESNSNAVIEDRKAFTTFEFDVDSELNNACDEDYEENIRRCFDNSTELFSPTQVESVLDKEKKYKEFVAFCQEPSKTNQYSSLIAECSKIISLFPHRCVPYYVRGNGLIQLKMYDDALKEVLELYENSDPQAESLANDLLEQIKKKSGYKIEFAFVVSTPGFKVIKDFEEEEENTTYMLNGKVVFPENSGCKEEKGKSIPAEDVQKNEENSFSETEAIAAAAIRNVISRNRLFAEPKRNAFKSPQEFSERNKTVMKPKRTSAPVGLVSKRTNAPVGPVSKRTSATEGPLLKNPRVQLPQATCFGKQRFSTLNEKTPGGEKTEKHVSQIHYKPTGNIVITTATEESQTPDVKTSSKELQRGRSATKRAKAHTLQPSETSDDKKRSQGQPTEKLSTSSVVERNHQIMMSLQRIADITPPQSPQAVSDDKTSFNSKNTSKDGNVPVAAETCTSPQETMDAKAKAILVLKKIKEEGKSFKNKTAGKTVFKQPVKRRFSSGPTETDALPVLQNKPLLNSDQIKKELNNPESPQKDLASDKNEGGLVKKEFPKGLPRPVRPIKTVFSYKKSALSREQQEKYLEIKAQWPYKIPDYLTPKEKGLLKSYEELKKKAEPEHEEFNELLKQESAKFFKKYRFVVSEMVYVIESTRAIRQRKVRYPLFYDEDLKFEHDMYRRSSLKFSSTMLKLGTIPYFNMRALNEWRDIRINSDHVKERFPCDPEKHIVGENVIYKTPVSEDKNASTLAAKNNIDVVFCSSSFKALLDLSRRWAIPVVVKRSSRKDGKPVIYIDKPLLPIKFVAPQLNKFYYNRAYKTVFCKLRKANRLQKCSEEEANDSWIFPCHADHMKTESGEGSGKRTMTSYEDDLFGNEPLTKPEEAKKIKQPEPFKGTTLLDTIMSEQKNLLAAPKNPVKEEAKPSTEEIQEEEEWMQPRADQNLVYRHFKLQEKKGQETNLMIRSHVDAVTEDRFSGFSTLYNVAVKVEYQVPYGLEVLSKSEAASHWAQINMHPGSTLLRARVNAFTGNIELLQSLTSNSINDEVEAAGFNSSQALGTMHDVLNKLQECEPGYYIVYNKKSYANEDVIIYKSTPYEKASALNLTKIELQLKEPSATPQNMPFLPVDPAVCLPSWRSEGRAPATFRPAFIKRLHRTREEAIKAKNKRNKQKRFQRKVKETTEW